MVNIRVVCGLALLAFSAVWGMADGGALHQAKQTKPIKLGTSGGNVNDKSRAFCCSGTLGALVTKGGSAQYILSNNHVLARLNKAASGEDISQPGLIDNNCGVFQSVADFSEAPGLGGTTNVDAAIAQVQPNAVDSEGKIIDLETISSTAGAPALNLSVMKSGRTTGLTTGNISSFADVNVQYQSGCGSGKKFVVSYTDQIVIAGSGFSAGGDSGSLIVSNDSSSCKQPVGLLFAGSSTTTIANRIGDVIAAFSPSLSFVGTSTTISGCPVSTTSTSATSFGPSQAAVDHARTVKDRHKANILPMANVLGIGVGAADDNPSEAVIVIYVETGRVLPEAVPDFLDGLRVKVVTTEPFVAYGNQKWGDNRCSGK